MIKVEILPGKTPSTELIIFHLSRGIIVFPSHLDARRWQFQQIFGINPDFSILDGSEESYILDVFDLKNEFSTNLVTGEPCRISHLQRLAEAMDRDIFVENYLVLPSYNN